ncbi:hypothetical protein [Streptosporangium minutum]|uniref:Uncharacterized protein n=1 Tax=Streptosporangium minutum TaxID=569862 RepID=A0A2C9ZM49_9ACTN|nr:hypothetical protein [Streptosporangium minutum]OUC95971.1 hypothetical protein CA984_16750 [Streptosporangium minutum]
MDPQPVLCHTCTGVLLANDSRTYTPQRGRLIVSNGYCTCPPAEAPVEPEAPRQQPQQERLPGQATMVNV